MLVISFDVGIKNLAYSLIRYEPANDATNYDVLHQTNLLEWHKVNLASNKYDIDRLTTNLLEVLDNIAYHQVDNIQNENVHVVIENQPALKSPTMKTIQIIIHTFFNTLAKYGSLHLCTKFVSAKSKLKYIDSFHDFKDYMNTQQNTLHGGKRVPKEKEGYAKNKDISVQFTQWLLNSITMDSKHKNELEALKKKDDLCDCYLQGLYYINTIKAK